MNRYTKNEFYGDLLIYKVEKWRKRGSSWVFYILVLLFLIVFVGLIFQPENTSQLLNSFAGDTQTSDQESVSYRLLASIGLVLILMPFLPTVLHVTRKYWLYPKASLTQQAFCVIQSKELIIHPRTRNSNGNPRSYYVKVQHPRSKRLVPVDVDQEWFNEVKEGDQVYTHYHPAEDNVLYLSSRAG